MAVKPRVVAPISVSAEGARNSRRFTRIFYATGFNSPGSNQTSTAGSCNVTPLEGLMALKIRNAGMTVLGVYLILVGLSGLIAIGLPSVLMAALALVAGILILAGR